MARKKMESRARAKGRGVLFNWIPAAPGAAKRPGRAPAKGIPGEFEEGEWDPVDAWMQTNGGSVPEEQLFVFVGSGANIAIADVVCGRSYYTMYKAVRAVRGCPAPGLVLRRVIRKAKARAYVAALRVRRACIRRPSCEAVIKVQVRAWGCATYGQVVNGQFAPQRYEAWAGFVYRIECIQA
jgi:hypothetical protein